MLKVLQTVWTNICVKLKKKCRKRFKILVTHIQGIHFRQSFLWYHDDVIKWKHFPRFWLFVWGIYRSPVYSPHKGQWRGALMFSLICAWINGWVNNREAGDLRHHRAHYDVIVKIYVVIQVHSYDLINWIWYNSWWSMESNQTTLSLAVEFHKAQY